MDVATEALRNEHRGLSKCLNFTQSLADRIRQREEIEPQVLGEVIECFRVFMDDCLLAKEENVLFPALAKKGLSRQNGLLSWMLVEHESGRKLLGEMAETAAECDAGERGSSDRWAVAAMKFVELIRDHIREEEGALFKIADSFLQSAEHVEIAAGFESLEAQKSSSGRHRRIHAMLEELPREIGQNQPADGGVTRGNITTV